MTTIAEKVEAYIKIRDYVEAAEKSVDAQLKPYREAMKVVTNQLLELMTAENLDNVKTEHGTAYRKLVDNVTVEDWDQALRHIVGEQAWHLLERRVNKTAAQEILDETGQPLPGCKHNRAYVVQVRRAA